MSREVRILIVAIAAVVMLFFGLGSALADRWEVSSSLLVPGPPDRALALVGDFRTWREWSALATTERADTRIEIEGDAGAVGHRLAWKSGNGEAALRLSRVAEDGIDYEFLTRLGDEPLRARGSGSVRFAPQGGDTMVTWTDRSEVDGLMGRWFAWFGAQQDSQQKFQQASLSGLRLKLEGK